MKIAVVLVLFLDYALTTYAGISHAETSGITRLTEGVLSPECNEEGCIVRDEGVNLINTVIVHKRHAKHKKHKKHGQSIRHLIHQTAKEAKSITKRLKNEVMKRKLKMKKLARKRTSNLRTRSNTISNLVKMSSSEYRNIELKPDVVKNMTVSNARETLHMVNKTVDTWEKSITEAATSAKELTKFYIDELKKFSSSSNKKVKDAVRSGDIEGAKKIKDENEKIYEKMLKSMSKTLDEALDWVDKSLKRVGSVCEKVMVGTAKKHSDQIKEVTGKNPSYTAFQSLSTNLTKFSKDSAAKSKEFTKNVVQNLSEFRKDIDKSVQEASDLGHELGQAIVNSDAEEVRRKETATKEALKKAEDENEKNFYNILHDVNEHMTNIFDKVDNLFSIIDNHLAHNVKTTKPSRATLQ